jgi:hypothetical protein
VFHAVPLFAVARRFVVIVVDEDFQGRLKLQPVLDFSVYCRVSVPLIKVTA